MKRIIVDYRKLNNEILSLLVKKFPDGYGDDDIVKFRNTYNEAIEAIEVRSDDTVYLVKVSTRLAYTMEHFHDDDVGTVLPPGTIAMPDENPPE